MTRIASCVLFFLLAGSAFAGSCLSCHVIAGWKNGAHAKAFGAANDSACLKCHLRHPFPFPADAPAFAYLRWAKTGGVTTVHASCERCHADIQTQFQKLDLGGSAMPLVWQGHKPFYGDHPVESVLLGSHGEFPHIECTDCHNPHAAGKNAPLRGAKGIDIHGNIVNGEKTSATLPDYEVCFRCHGDSYSEIQPFPYPTYRVIPPSNTNKRREFDPDSRMRLQPELSNTSFHPVAFPGKNDSPELEEQLVRATHGKLHVTSMIRCDDCHNNDSRAPGEPKGPHGSIHKSILAADYSTKVGDDSSSPYARYNPENFALCFKCHDHRAFDSGPNNQETGFYQKNGWGNLHYLHLTGEGGKLSSYESCQECHYNPHGNVETDTTRFVVLNAPMDTHLLWFFPGVKGIKDHSDPTWSNVAGTRSCAMICHLKKMNFTYGGP